MMVLLEIKRTILVEEVNTGTIVTEERTGRNSREIVIRAEPEFNGTCRHRINQIDSRRSDFTGLQRKCLAANAINQFAFTVNSFQLIQIKGGIIHYKSRGCTLLNRSRSNRNRCLHKVASPLSGQQRPQRHIQRQGHRIDNNRITYFVNLCGVRESRIGNIRHLVTRNVRNAELVERTRSSHCAILTGTLHAAVGLVTDNDQVFVRDTACGRSIALVMFHTGNHLVVKPHTHVAITPLAGNQVPVIIFKLSRTLYIVMLVMMVLLEVELTILIEEMNTGSIISDKGARSIVKISIRTEPEFNSSNLHRINQIHAQGRHLTVLQLKTIAANTFDHFTFVKQRFQFVEVAGIFVHRQGRIPAMTTHPHIFKDGTTAVLRNGIKVTRNAKFIDSCPHILGIVFLKRRIIISNYLIRSGIRFGTPPNKSSHGHQRSRKPFHHFLTHFILLSQK